jgi:hypothetical protein
MSMKVSIVRVESGTDGTFGVLCIEGKAFCVTLEPILLGDPQEPIPNGTYKAVRYNSPKNKREVWLLKDVPGYTYVEIHIGNLPHETLGCILVGEYFDKLRGNRAIKNSGATFEKLMQITRNENELLVTVASCFV